MTLCLAFDVYGTLIDPSDLTRQLRQTLGDGAEEFYLRWRDKQLEYSFRRGLMGAYVDFARCTREALVFTCASTAAPFDARAQERLLDAWAHLPAFADSAAGLQRLQQRGARLYAFSNGSQAAVAALLEQAGLADHFAEVVSVEAVRSFKPAPSVYRHLLSRTRSPAEATWLVSSNPFDVLGAQHAGLRCAWVRRSDRAQFDPWGIAPDLQVASLLELAERLAD
ncbi:haloacid dehalogenase type II [Pseudomonas lalucatii]|uniref:(S)-2-haloacid dehalogenase n=1 Tax=Pseudomonas lalucatii TaxID=1424203 RepID=A0ABS5Q6Q3_9PSED|nr:haloacid dehalogenase type II [Pseudomonas lalucatii]MBS7664422.1 haloacid dehalogenase type II [Pseudomonas lalucatii]MBS7725613.1 haloacid dehalogenase type II [Pseudomonas lalucatii]QVM88768.1 haloacid dehalogenase type II [Pseudomonas lalucatii]